jgi:hypothetical protein
MSFAPSAVLWWSRVGHDGGRRTAKVRARCGVVSDALFRVVGGAVAVVAAAVVARLIFFHAIVLPELPPQPVATPAKVATAVAAVAATERDPAAYAEQLARDSRELRIDPPATPADLSGVMPYRADTERRVLEPERKRSTASVLGLDLSLAVDKIAGTPRSQMVLTIENTTDDHLAYRVMTQSSRGLRACFAKSDLAHNAIALAPGEKVRRSECIHRKGLKLFVDRVETIRLPRLSYYYVSGLPGRALEVDRRDGLAARGHLPAGGRSPCRVFRSAEVQSALAGGSATWRDLVDFYARHPCGVYSFTIDYKAFDKEGEQELPFLAGRQ